MSLQHSLPVQPVVLCGGSGTRLWPLSRAGFPKQFLCLTDKDSLFQLTVRRAMLLESQGITVEHPIVVSNEEHRFLVIEQLREIGVEPKASVLEPAGRNTAPALTMAALTAIEDGNDPILVVMAADQVISDHQAFVRAMHSAIREAEKGLIVILGVKPSHANTGYGYIRTDGQDMESATVEALRVAEFVEKPDAVTAQHYLESGDYYWNAGIFVLRASRWLEAIELFRSDIAQGVRLAWSKRVNDTAATIPFLRPGKEEFLNVASQSIDYAVIEHCPRAGWPIGMVPLTADWSDLGTWDSVWQALPKDAAGNIHRGDVLAIDSSNTLVQTTGRLVSLVGVSDLVVIETADAVLVADRSRSQDVKDIVTLLDANEREEHNLHRKVHRPWGWYDCIDDGQRFKVKRIQVKPKASLSLQMHHHRAEHWIVVSGTAEITCGSNTRLLSENQSTYIPLGEIHRLANPGEIPLEIIEVQSGSYLGEDDIVRYGDSYGRAPSNP